MIATADGRDPACILAGRWARLLAEKGANPLPSRADQKRPALRAYRDYLHGEPVPEAWFDRWWTPNIQVALGPPWPYVVVDLDGPEALGAWNGWRRRHGAEPTWTVRTGSGGWHLWFRLPPGLPPFRSRLLWADWDPAGGKDGTGGWHKHREARLLGQGFLAVAPPSAHVVTGRPYEWLAGRGPLDLDGPAELPGWVLDLPEPRQPRKAPRSYPVPAGWDLPGAGDVPAGSFRRADVLAALADDHKAALARSWGLVLADDRPNGRGFVRCHALGRDDRSPSAGFHAAGGFYSEPGAGPGGRALVLSLFDLAVALGAYPDWRSCCDDLGRRLRLAPAA